MRGTLRAGLAAGMLTCAFTPAGAAGVWLTDADSACAVLASGAGDRVAWNGPCEDGLASGAGTATFLEGDKVVQSFTADFSRGMVADGHVITRWGNGWRYDGETAHGRFNGGGILINDKQDRYLGVWTDGRMNGFGLLDRADGSRYAGEWKDDLPNGEGELRRADGSVVSGLFVDGKLARQAAAAPKADTGLKPAAFNSAEKIEPSQPATPFAGLAGRPLKGVDGSAIVLNPIEGGIEMALTAVGGAAPQKTTFTFMTDRLGTVVEDGGPGHGANVTGFFRLTGTGVELHYADGRAEMLSATAEGGVTMMLTGDHATCRSWYPDGHVFSDAEKKAALADYAARLGLGTNAADAAGCGAASLTPASLKPETIQATPRPAIAEHRGAPRAKPVKTAFSKLKTSTDLTPVIVKDSDVHAVDDMTPLPAPGAALAGAGQELQPATRKADAADPSHCLKVDSDGHNWGFRNACDFPVQFAYCVPTATDLTACARGGAPGSVAARGFGALTADRSLSESGVEHSFRWIACAGGAGEVAARLEKADPPSGRCDRAPSNIAAR